MTEGDQRMVSGTYMAMVSLIDNQMGRLLAALEASGEAADTL